VRSAAVAVARELERRRPDLITAQWWKEDRGERVFVDFNQNAPHKTVFGTWCVRPRVGAQVSCPIPWDEVATVDLDALTIANVPAKVEAEGNPWAAMNDEPQDISVLIDWYDRDLDDGLMDAPWPPQYPKMPNEPPRVSASRAKKDPPDEP
jgi:DNA primase